MDYPPMDITGGVDQGANILRLPITTLDKSPERPYVCYIANLRVRLGPTNAALYSESLCMSQEVSL